MSFVGNLLLFAAVKEFHKSINNWQSNRHGYGDTFLTHAVGLRGNNSSFLSNPLISPSRTHSSASMGLDECFPFCPVFPVLSCSSLTTTFPPYDIVSPCFPLSASASFVVQGMEVFHCSSSVHAHDHLTSIVLNLPQYRFCLSQLIPDVNTPASLSSYWFLLVFSPSYLCYWDSIFILFSQSPAFCSIH